MVKVQFDKESGIVRKKVEGRITYVVDTDHVTNYRKAFEMIREDAGSRGLLKRFMETEIQVVGSKQEEFLKSYKGVRDWTYQNQETQRQLMAMNEEEIFRVGKRGLFGLGNLIDNILYQVERAECETDFPLGLRAREMHMVGAALSPLDYSLKWRVLQD